MRTLCRNIRLWLQEGHSVGFGQMSRVIRLSPAAPHRLPPESLGAPRRSPRRLFLHACVPLRPFSRVHCATRPSLARLSCPFALPRCSMRSTLACVGGKMPRVFCKNPLRRENQLRRLFVASLGHLCSAVVPLAQWRPPFHHHSLTLCIIYFSLFH